MTYGRIGMFGLRHWRCQGLWQTMWNLDDNLCLIFYFRVYVYTIKMYESEYKIHINCKPFNETKIRWKCKFLCHVYKRCLWKFSFVKNARYAMFCLGKNTQPDIFKLRTHHFMACDLDFYMEIFLTSIVKW